jgi:hypothetical protein
VDGVKNGSETAVDCGGSCPRCADGAACGLAADCQSGVCTGGLCQAPSCSDGVKNGGEADVDCGGTCAARCATGGHCTGGADCQSGVCSGNLCAAASCVDGVKNGSETAVDCGGSCPRCADGAACALAADCQSGVCTANLCRAPTCVDGVKNGTETALDCGGGCPGCADGLACTLATDCLHLWCDPSSRLCRVPLCANGVKDGAESDVDCGGACTPCANGKACNVPGDCQAGGCVAGICGATKTWYVGLSSLATSSQGSGNTWGVTAPDFCSLASDAILSPPVGAAFRAKSASIVGMATDGRFYTVDVWVSRIRGGVPTTLCTAPCAGPAVDFVATDQVALSAIVDTSNDCVRNGFGVVQFTGDSTVVLDVSP